MNCECKIAGWCDRHRMQKSDRMVHLCQNDELYFQKWESQKDRPGQRKRRQKKTVMGVGDLLKQSIQSYGYKDFAGCDCQSMVRKMNRWGPEGCRKRIEAIVGHLEDAAKKTGWVERFVLATPGINAIAKWGIEKLVMDAIENTEKTVVAEEKVCSMEHKMWSVVVTTAPREGCTLKRCIASLRDCGWEPIVFAEPGSTATDAVTIVNPERLGAWHNFLNSVAWTLENTDANVILTAQDDSLFHPDSREFVESILWPSCNTGFISLYTAKHYSHGSPGLKKLNVKYLWGACALVWPRDILEEFVESEIAKNWLGAKPKSRRSEVFENRKANPHLIANVDTAIGHVLIDMQADMYFVDPSPVQHIAKHSTLGHGGNHGRRNAGRPADHLIPLKDQVPL
jgi:hypothetical protein